MKSILLLSTTLAGLMLASASFAQNINLNDTRSNATSGSNSTSGAASNAAANSGPSSNAQNITFNSTAPAATTSTNTTNDRVSYSGGTTNWNNNSGDVTVRSAPTVYAPPVSGGNPCTLAVSGGASFLGWGAAAGGTFVDSDCANRQKIAMIWNAGFKGAAKELMCNDRDSYFAFRTAGEPCAYRAGFEGGAPQPAPQPQPTPVTMPATMPVTTAPTVAPRVAGPLPSAQTLRRCRGANDQGPCYSG